MNTSEWLEEIAPGATTNALATRAGVYTSTLDKQIKRGQLSAEVVIKIARAYGAPVIEGLVCCGHITEEEAQLRYTLEAGISLKDATDQQLLWELLDRVDEDGALAHPGLTEELDSNNPALKVFDGEGAPVYALAAKRDVRERPDSLYDQ